MPRECAVCGKGKQTGFTVSHSHIKTKRNWAPNLQRVKAIVNKAPKRILVCTRCLRSGKVERAL